MAKLSRNWGPLHPVADETPRAQTDVASEKERTGGYRREARRQQACERGARELDVNAAWARVLPRHTSHVVRQPRGAPDHRASPQRADRWLPGHNLSVPQAPRETSAILGVSPMPNHRMTSGISRRSS